MSNIQEIYEKFSRHKSGVAFMKDDRKRTKLAFRLVRHFCHQWDYIVWIAPTASLRMRRYVTLVNDNAGNMAVKIVFFSQENISGNDWQYLKLFNLAGKYKLFCIIDEGINIKNTDAALTKRLHAMRHKFAFRLLLSKNPVTTSIKDIYGQMMFLDPLVFNMTDTQFLHNYMPQFVSEHHMVKRWSVSQSEQKAVELMKPYILACDFDNRVRIKYREYWFELTNKEKKAYQQEKDKLLKGLVHGGYLSVAQNFQYYYTLCLAKVVTLRRILSDIAKRGEKVIIYTKYSGEINFLEETGLLDTYQYVIMTGTSNKNRASLLFEVDYDIMICTYKVKIPRLNLHDCTNLIYFTQTFDYKDKLYILSKFGESSRKKLRVYDFWVNTRLENLIKDNLARKQKLLNNVCEIMTRHKVATHENLSG